MVPHKMKLKLRNVNKNVSKAEVPLNLAGKYTSAATQNHTKLEI